MSRNTPARMKDVLLEHISRDIKELQSLQSDMSTVVDMVPSSNTHALALCEHLDHILMHGLREYDRGYWPFVSYFTRSEAIHTISNLSNVTTEIGRGRAWLYMALNEQALESYIRMFLENQMITQEFYLRESFLRDMERLLLLLTLVSGLDFISFDLSMDYEYMDYGPTRRSTVIAHAAELTPDIEPKFISSVTPQTRRKLEMRRQRGSSPSKNMSSREATPPNQLPSNSITETLRLEDTRQDSDVTIATARDTSVVRPRDNSGGCSEKSAKMVESGKLGEDTSRPRKSSTKAKKMPRNAPIPIPDAQMSRDTDIVDDSGALHGGSLPISILKRMSDSAAKDQLSYSLEERKDGGNERMRGGGLEVEEEKLDEDIAVPVRGRKKNPHKKSKKRQKKRRSDGETSTSDASRLEDTRLQDVVESREQVGGSVTMEQGDEQTVEGGLIDDEEDLQLPKCTTEPDAFFFSSAGRKGNEDGEEGEREGGGGKAEGEGGSRLNADISNVDVDSQPVEECDGEVEVKGRCETEADEKEPQTSVPGVEAKDTRTELPWSSAAVSTVPTGSDPFSEAREVPPSSVQLMEDSRQYDRSFHRPKQIDLGLTDDGDDSHMQEQVSRWTDEQGPPHGATREGTAPSHTRPTLVSPLTESVTYKAPPVRPQEMTEVDKHAADMKIDENMRVVFSLDVFFTPEEQVERLIRVSTPAGVGQQRIGFVLITSDAVYLLRNEGIEGLYSKELGIRYTEFEHIVIGLGWQSIIFVYEVSSEDSSEEQKCVILTGSEAVSRSMVDSIRSAAALCPGFLKSIPLNRDDESRIEAIEKELIKQGSHTSMDIVRYSLVNWEQLSGQPPQTAARRQEEPGVSKSGQLQFKSVHMLGISQWKPAYFELRDGFLYQYNSESDKVVKSTYQIRKCGGCTRSTTDNKPYVLSVMGSDGPLVVLATSTEEELAQWMATLCQAAVEETPTSPTLISCSSCTILLTQNKIHVLQEDWSDESVQLVTSCWVTDVNDISVDRALPLYCTISYDQGLWLVCFSSEYELGKFESALAAMWKEQFQIDLQFSEVSAVEVRERAHRAVELMQSSMFRSDSITRGRTEFTYSST